MIEKMRWESMILLPEGEIKKHPHHPPPISPFLDLGELKGKGTTGETTRLELAFDVMKSKCKEFKCLQRSLPSILYD